MKLKYFIPLATFLVPTIVIGYGFVIPGSCIGGVNEHSMGFTATVVFAALTYWMGLRTVLADQDSG